MYVFVYACRCVFVCTCMYLYTHICVCVCVHMYVCVCRSEVDVGCFSQSLSTLRDSLLQNLELVSLAGPAVSSELQDPPAFTSPVLGLQASSVMPDFSMNVLGMG